jgi:hypothetical protein
VARPVVAAAEVAVALVARTSVAREGFAEHDAEEHAGCDDVCEREQRGDAESVCSLSMIMMPSPSAWPRAAACR